MGITESTSQEGLLTENAEPPETKPLKGRIIPLGVPKVFMAIKLQELQAGAHPLTLLTCVR